MAKQNGSACQRYVKFYLTNIPLPFQNAENVFLLFFGLCGLSYAQ